MHHLRNQTGQPVYGEDFFNREREIEEIWDLIENERSNLLILAPRRVGKTSVMHRLEDQAEDRQILAVYATVSKVSTEAGFIQGLFEALVGHTKIQTRRQQLEKDLTRANSRLKKVSIGASGMSFELQKATDESGEDWRTLFERSLILLTAGNERLLLLVDEIAVFVLSLLGPNPDDTDIERVRSFMLWLRAMREDRRFKDNVSWIMAGSIGLDSVVDRLRLGGTIGDMHLYRRLGPFDRDSADGLLHSLGLSYELPLSEPVRQRCLDKLGWHLPYYIQLIFHEIRNLCQDRACEPSAEIADAAYDALLQPSGKKNFDYWRQRLRLELGKLDASHADCLLETVARAGFVTADTFRARLEKCIADPDEREEKLRYLLDVLQVDGYLVRSDDGRYQFLSPLLRDFWLRRVLL